MKYGEGGVQFLSQEFSVLQGYEFLFHVVQLAPCPTILGLFNKVDDSKIPIDQQPPRFGFGFLRGFLRRLKVLSRLQQIVRGKVVGANEPLSLALILSFFTAES